ncbi:hypothetical protein TPA0907_19590 [Micromonospora humidisoli]|uniref:Uncharacterized protein n=1 Tax=Micromonospora humidisoli TaxID=2807622 RepID=A0ABS2JFT3_9ACTN|nr:MULTISPECIES: hypothetical protein [Micromonospora]MBM7085362.1 hypothetical protein [Micromonospora humidisoli]GHJ07592.1 hypothetical protein TPA0907_19590 [Micromonospora sp. AKA109]
MTGRQKLLLVMVAVLLVAGFVGALGLGHAGRGDPADPGAPGWLGRLGGNGATVDPATVRADCDRTGDVLSFVGGCALRVDDPGGLRTLVLRSGAAFAVTAPAPGDADLTIRDDVTPADGGDAVATIAVDRATEVGLGCPGGVSCTVTIATS